MVKPQNAMLGQEIKYGILTYQMQYKETDQKDQCWELSRG